MVTNVTQSYTELLLPACQGSVSRHAALLLRCDTHENIEGSEIVVVSTSGWERQVDACTKASNLVEYPLILCGYSVGCTASHPAW